jgi:hypothetical protein
MLFLEVSLAVVRSRKRLTAAWKVTGEGTLAMNGIYMTTKILLESKSLSIGTAGDVTSESSLVALGMLTTK